MGTNLNLIFDERICPVCGKTYFKAPESIYKYRDKANKVKHVCSYTCYVKKLKELGRW